MSSYPESYKKKVHFAKIYRKVLSTTPTLIIKRNPFRRNLTVINRDSSINIELRSEPSTAGLLLKPDEFYENEGFCQGRIWMLSASGTPTVHIEEDVEEEWRESER